MKLVTNLNSGIDHSTFEWQTNHIWVQDQKFNMGTKCYVTKGNFD